MSFNHNQLCTVGVSALVRSDIQTLANNFSRLLIRTYILPGHGGSYRTQQPAPLEVCMYEKDLKIGGCHKQLIDIETSTYTNVSCLLPTIISQSLKCLVMFFSRIAHISYPRWRAIRWALETFEGLFYRLISPVLLSKSKPPQYDPALRTSMLSDEEIKRLIGSSPRVDAGAFINPLLGAPDGGHVAKIAPDTVVKISSHTGVFERLSAELVRRYTCIPVPMHGRVIRDLPSSYAVQQYIPGRVLLDAWPQLGWWMRLRVAITLRFYIHELRSISFGAGLPPFPGPPSDDGRPQKCTGQLFTEDGSGPFRSYREMSRWYQNRLLVLQRIFKQDVDSEPFDDSDPLVFSHMDLHPRNMILGNDGQLWIVDWADAGWYPPWFESASMTLFPQFRPEIPYSWTRLIPFIAGSCQKPGQLAFIRAIAYSLVVCGSEIVNLVGGSA